MSVSIAHKPASIRPKREHLKVYGKKYRAVVNAPDAKTIEEAVRELQGYLDDIADEYTVPAHQLPEIFARSIELAPRRRKPAASGEFNESPALPNLKEEDPDPLQTFIPNEEDAQTFSRLFNNICNIQIGLDASLIGDFKGFVKEASERYAIPLDTLPSVFIRHCGISLSDEELKQTFSHLASHGHDISKNLLSKSTVIRTVREYMDEYESLPQRDAGVIRQGDLADGSRTWADVWDWIENEDNQTLGEFCCNNRIFVYQKNYHGVLTIKKILESARLETAAKKRRPTCNDPTPMAYGALAATGLTPQAVEQALLQGSHGLKNDPDWQKGMTLAKVLDKYDVHYKLTIADILESARLQTIETGCRPKVNDTTPITFGPLAATGLSWVAIDSAIRAGIHFLKEDPEWNEEMTLARLMNKNDIGIISFSIADIVEAARLETQAKKRRPTYRTQGAIEFGKLKKTGLTWSAINQALMSGGHNLRTDPDWHEGMTLSKLMDDNGIGNISMNKDFIIPAIRAYMDEYESLPQRDAGIIQKGDLADGSRTWADVWDWAEKEHDQTLGKFCCDSHVFVYQKRYQGVLTIDTIVNWARLETDKEKHRPTKGDMDPITISDLAATGLTPKAIDLAIRNGAHGLKNDPDWQEGMTLASTLDKHNIRYKLTIANILESARLQTIKTGFRPNLKDADPIAFGPLAGTGLSWHAVASAIRRGGHFLKDDPAWYEGMNLFKLMEINDIGVFNITISDIIKATRLETEIKKHRPTNATPGDIEFGKFAETGFTWNAIELTLMFGRNGLKNDPLWHEGITLAKLMDNCRIYRILPSGKEKIPPVNLNNIPAYAVPYWPELNAA